MDERDYKAMNDELKILSECGITFGLANSREQCLNAMREYADQFKQQLKEKEEQLTKSNEMAERLYECLDYAYPIVIAFTAKEYGVHPNHQKLLNSIKSVLTEYQNSKK